MSVSGKTQGHIILSGSPSGLIVLTHYSPVYILMRVFTLHTAQELNSINVCARLPRGRSA